MASDSSPAAPDPEKDPAFTEAQTVVGPSDQDRTRTLPPGDPGADEPPSSAEHATVDGRAPGGGLARPRVLGPYTLVRLLGRGGMGAVWEAVDFRLDRRVALKVTTGDPSPDATERFRREATHSARLRHPHIVSVHDVGFDHGQQYLVMDLVHGVTLAEALRTGRLSYRDKAAILEKIARAVHYAHEQGVVHRDLKPSNVMLESRRGGEGGSSARSGSLSAVGRPAQAADFGEPLVMDFGLAKDTAADSSLSRSGQAVGTPSYMPPEQAEGRIAEVSPRSDVYSLGAILYEMLTGRPPFTGENVMQVLRAVVSDEPVPPRRISRDVPRDLETICLACLAKPASRRYASAEALAEDLRCWLAGESIAARPATLLERTARRIKRHRMLVTVCALILPTLLTLGLLYAEHLKEVATWGSPILVENFADESWRSRWLVKAGSFERRDGRIVSTGAQGNVLCCYLDGQKLLGPTAIEYEGEILPGEAACDISLIWANDVQLSADGKSIVDLVHPLELKIGAYDGDHCAIMLGARNLDFNDFKPQPGVRYQVRIEIVDNRATLAVDGRLLCEYVDPFPLVGGYPCLYGFYPGKAFGAVRISSLGTPQKVPATAVGDAFAEQGLYAEAAEQYGRLVRAHPGTAIADEARYKQGLCRYRANDHDAAFALWQPLASTRYAPEIGLYRLDLLAEASDVGALGAELEAQYRRAAPAIRKRIALRWAEYVGRGLHDGEKERLTALIALHDRVLADAGVVDFNAAECLMRLGRFDELLRRYPRQRLHCSVALQILGRYELIADEYPDQRAQCAWARVLAGQYDRLHELAPADRAVAAMVMVDTGHADQVAAAFPTDALVNASALLALGRLDEVVARYPDTFFAQSALIFAGRSDEVAPSARRELLLAQRRFDEIGETPEDSQAHWLLRLCRGLEATIAGTPAPDLFALPETYVDHDTTFTGDRLLLAPYVLELGGERGDLDRACAEILAHHRYAAAQRMWHAARLIQGSEDSAAFLAQPYQLYVAADLVLWQAIRDERSGQMAAAAAGYRAYLDLPRWQRAISVDPFRERFAEWRIATIGGNQ